MLAYLLTNYYLKQKKKIGKLSLEILISIVIFIHEVIILYLFSIPHIYKTILGHIDLLNNSLFLINIFILAFYKYKSIEHKIILILPIKKKTFTALLLIQNLLQIRTILLTFIFSLYIMFNFQIEQLTIKIVFIIILTIFYSNSLLLYRFAKLSKSRNLLDYLSIIFILSFFIFPNSINILYTLLSSFFLIFITSIRLHNIVFSAIKNVNSVNINDKLKHRLHFNKFFSIQNSLIRKEVYLLFRNSKGRAQLLMSLLYPIVIAVLYTLFGSHLNNTIVFSSFILYFSCGYALAEYFQYIFSWDYQNVGLMAILPLSSPEVIKSKLAVVKIILATISISSIVVFEMMTNYWTAPFFFLLNIFLLPHIFILISLNSVKKDMYINKSIFNTRYFIRPIKTYISISIISVIEYILIFLFESDVIDKYFLVINLLIVILLVIIEKRIVNLFSPYYKKWKYKFFNKKEKNFVF